MRFDEETREWILYYTDRFGRDVTWKKFPPNRRFARLEALRAAQPRGPTPAGDDFASRAGTCTSSKVAADMDAHWPEFTSMDGRRPAADWAPYWDAALGSRSAASPTLAVQGSGVGAYFERERDGVSLAGRDDAAVSDTAATSVSGALGVFEGG